jgi:hypothetical protein
VHALVLASVQGDLSRQLPLLQKPLSIVDAMLMLRKLVRRGGQFELTIRHPRANCGSMLHFL